MSQHALRSLEQLRAMRVEQGQRELQAAREEQDKAAELLLEARRALSEVMVRPPAQRVQSPRDYLWLERVERARLLSATQRQARFLVAQRVHTAALELVQSAQVELLRLEVERRAAAHTVARREAETARVTELRSEEEAADSHSAGRF